MSEIPEQKNTEVPLLKSPPPLVVRWFHAIDNPIIDPIAVRNAKREASLHQLHNTPPSPPPPPRTSPKNWVPFSKRDTQALEKAFQENSEKPVSVNEDHLFQVNVTKREITPVYWEGPIYEVRRATWFMQGDSASKWIPCEEKMSKQIEEGYQKHKPYAKPVKQDSDVIPSLQEQNQESPDTSDEKKTPPPEEEKKPNEEEEVEEKEEKEYLLGPYLGQYVVYTSPSDAWLLYDTTSAKIAKNFFTLLTKNQNLGGTKLIRGYREVEAKEKKEAETKDDKESNKYEDAIKEKSRQMASDTVGKISAEKRKEMDDIEMTKRQAEDYENEDSEELRDIDQVVFVIHGIGQKMSERMGQNFVHDVNLLRKTMKTTWPIAVSGTSSLDRSNGIQVLPILWRKGIEFGSEDSGEGNSETDMGMTGDDDGSPTIGEITLDGAPNIRTLVTDVFLDIPLYMTNRYHDQMINVITKEINRVYQLFIDRNPTFLTNNGKVTILAHSLGSLLAFDILSAQPLTSAQKLQAERSGNDVAFTEKKVAKLAFPVKNYFAVGSPLGMIMLLRGHKMISRKTLDPVKQNALSKYNVPPVPSTNFSSQFNDQTAPITFIYPACDNVYNIFHKSDPVAYRLEPLVVRHYGAKLKPEPIAYIKGGLKSVLDAGVNMGNDIATKANAMFESFRMGVTSSILMRGLGFSKPLENAYPDADMHLRSASDPELQKTRAAAKSAAKLKLLNPTGRVDFCLQEGILENAYLSALSVHMSYWQDVDVAGFLIREIYRKEDNPDLVLV